MNQIIKYVTHEIDKTIDQRKENLKLLELVVNVMADQKDLPQKFVDMIYEIHEADSFTSFDEKEVMEYNLHGFDWFINFLKDTKMKNIEFWS